MTSTYDDDDDAHMNVFLEYLHHLFKPSYQSAPQIIELVVPPQPDMNNCGHFLVRKGVYLKAALN